MEKYEGLFEGDIYQKAIEKLRVKDVNIIGSQVAMTYVIEDILNIVKQEEGINPQNVNGGNIVYDVYTNEYVNKLQVLQNKIIDMDILLELQQTSIKTKKQERILKIFEDLMGEKYQESFSNSPDLVIEGEFSSRGDRYGLPKSPDEYMFDDFMVDFEEKMDIKDIEKIIDNVYSRINKNLLSEIKEAPVDKVELGNKVELGKEDAIETSKTKPRGLGR